MTTARQYAFTEEDVQDPEQLTYLLNRLLSQIISIRDTLDTIADGATYKKVTAVDGSTHQVTNASLADRLIDNRKLVQMSVENLIQNPGFEQSNASISPWTTVGYTGNGGSWSISTSNARSGGNALMFNPNSPVHTGVTDIGPTPFGASGILYCWPCNQNDTFYFETWGRKVGTGVPPFQQCAIRFLDINGGNLGGNTSGALTPTQSYQLIATTATAPAAAAYVIFFLRANFNSGEVENVLYDDCYARRMIGTTVIEDTSISTNKLQANAVTAAKIASHTITANEIAADTITSNEIAANAITASELAANSVTAGKIAAGTVTATEIAANTITTTKLTAGFRNTLTQGDSLNALQNPGIEDGQVFWNSSLVATTNATNAHSGNKYLLKSSATDFDDTGQVDENGTQIFYEVDAGDVVAFGGWVYIESMTGARNASLYLSWHDKDKVNIGFNIQQTATIGSWVQLSGTTTMPSNAKYVLMQTSFRSGTGTTTARFDDLFLTVQIPGPSIVATSITAGQIAANTITAAQIAANTITAGQIAAATITATQIATDTITATQIAANAITTSELNANAVTAAKIASHTITANEIAADTITASEIAANAITTSELNAGAVTAAKIASHTITANEIAADTITASEIAANAITASEISAGAITASKLFVGAPGSALNVDPAPSDATTWIAGTGNSGSVSIQSISDGQVGNTTLRGTAATTRFYNTPTFPLDFNKTYRIRCWYRSGASANGTFYLVVHLLDSTNTRIDGTASGGSGGTFWYYPVSAAAATTTWTEAVGTFGAGTAHAFPTNARTMGAMVLLNEGGSVGYFEAQDIRIEEIVPGTLIKDGSITTTKISVSQLSAISADIGTVTAGQLHNVGNDAGILLTGSLPGGWTRYLDLVAAHTTFLKHDKLQLDYSGAATFNGTLRSLVGGSSTTAPAVQLLYVNGALSTNSGSEVSLATFSVPASAMATNGDTLRITLVGRTTATSRLLKFNYGGTTIINDVHSETCTVQILITRTGATAQRWICTYIDNAPRTTVTNGTAAETLSGAVTLDFRGNVNNVSFSFFYDQILVEYLGA